MAKILTEIEVKSRIMKAVQDAFEGGDDAMICQLHDAVCDGKLTGSDYSKEVGGVMVACFTLRD